MITATHDPQPASLLSEATVPARGGLVVYEADGDVRVDVRLEGDTVWLSQQQMAELFGRDRSVIAKHIRNVFESGELDPEATRANFAQVQWEADRRVTRDIEFYNLDVQGFTLNERRLREKGLTELDDAMRLLARTLSTHELVNDQGS